MLRFTPEQFAAHQQRVSGQSAKSPSPAARASPVTPFSGRDPATNKYRNKPTVVDGLRFASQREAERYQALKLLERAGQIRGLQLQVRYPLTVNGQDVATYVADFTYWVGDLQVVEDAKGVRTQVYALKAKLMKALYGITIQEV